MYPFCKKIWKESLNSDGQQFHQYQHHHSSQTSEYKRTTTHDVGNLCPGLGQAQKCHGGGVIPAKVNIHPFCSK